MEQLTLWREATLPIVTIWGALSYEEWTRLELLRQSEAGVEVELRERLAPPEDQPRAQPIRQVALYFKRKRRRRASR